MITPSKTPSMCPFSIFYPCWLQFKGTKYNNIYELYQRLMDWTRNPDVDALYKCYQIRLKQVSITYLLQADLLIDVRSADGIKVFHLRIFTFDD